MVDRRRLAARGDIAAKHLEGQVQADRFVEGEELEVINASSPVRREPSHDAALETEALKGERVTITVGRFEPDLDPDPTATPTPTPTPTATP